MAAIVVKGPKGVGKTRQVHAGSNGFREYDGIGQFNSTDATGTLDVPFLRVTEWSFSPVGTPASDEQIFLSGTEVDGEVIRAADGTFTIGRTGASKTSGLKFAFRFRGL